MNTLCYVAAFGIVCVVNSISLDKVKRQDDEPVNCYECVSEAEDDCITVSDSTLIECEEGEHCFIAYIKRTYTNANRQWYEIEYVDRGCIAYHVHTIAAVMSNGTKEYMGHNCYTTGCNDQAFQTTGEV